MKPLSYAEKDRKIHSVTRNSSCGRHSCCLLKSHSLKSSLLIDLDLVPAAMCPRIPLPVTGRRVVKFLPTSQKGLVFRGLLENVFLPSKKKWRVNAPFYTFPFPLVWDSIVWGCDVWSCGIHHVMMRQRPREAQIQHCGITKELNKPQVLLPSNFLSCEVIKGLYCLRHKYLDFSLFAAEVILS